MCESTPAIRKSCTQAKRCLTEQVDALFAKVRTVKNKQILSIFLEDMKLLKEVISKWDERIDSLQRGSLDVADICSTAEEIEKKCSEEALHGAASPLRSRSLLGHLDRASSVKGSNTPLPAPKGQNADRLQGRVFKSFPTFC